MAELEDPQQDPELTQQMILLTLMRLYDVQMAILSEMHDGHAEHLGDVHDAGKLITDFPWLAQE
jgi:hypothetical protein